MTKLVKYVTLLLEGRFPRSIRKEPDVEIRVIISELLEREINPGVASHGGVVELLDVRDGNVFIKMGGGCQGCASAAATLRDGVETSIRNLVPEIDEIFDTTDHAAGANPYYAR